MSKHAYYAYYDDKYRLYYYYDVFSNETTWVYPENDKVVDPETKKPFPNPDSLFPDIPFRPVRRLTIVDSVLEDLVHEKADNLNIEVNESHTENQEQNDSEYEEESEEEQNNNETSKNDKAEEEKTDEIKPPEIFRRRKKVSLNFEQHGPLYFPKEISDNAKQFRASDFAKLHFLGDEKGKKARRTKFTIENLVLFSDKPLSRPLLANLPLSHEKQAISCFNFILKITGVQHYSPNHKPLEKMIELLSSTPDLYDEVFFQLMKQTKCNPNNDWLISTWSLFLIIGSIFPASKNTELWVKNFLLNYSKENNLDKSILPFVQLTLIKFGARCSVGEPDKAFIDNFKNGSFSSKTCNEIALILLNCPYVFNVSLYEIMWGQRRSFPKCPIPFFLHQMCQALIHRNALTSEGIFRLPGNMKVVNEMAAAANRGEDVLSNIAVQNQTSGSIDDLASLLKLWTRELIEPIVPYASVAQLLKAYTAGNTIEFVTSELPKLNLMTLAYLIGFLQYVSSFAAQNKMTAKNLAICFGPNLIRANDQAILLNFSSGSMNDIIELLINDWDVSSVYPLSDNFLSPV